MVAQGVAHSGSTELEAIFKEHFHDPWVENLPRDVELLKRLKRKKGVGRSFRKKVHYDGNKSVDAYEEQDAFGAPGHQEYMESELPYKLYKVEIEATGFMRAASRGKGAYFEEFANNSRESLKDLRHKINRDMLQPDRVGPKYMDSIGYIVDDGQINGATGYAGIDFATHPWWKPYVLANGGATRPLDLDLMQNMSGELWTPERAADISLICTSRNHWYDYGNLMESWRRSQNTTELDGGFTALDFENQPVVSIKGMPDGDMYFLDESKLQYTTLKEFESEQKDVLRDATYMMVTHYANLHCTELRKMGRIGDIGEEATT